MDSVEGLRYVGFSSASVTTIQNPLAIDKNKITSKGKQDLDGYRKIKLANSIYDPEFFERGSTIEMKQYSCKCQHQKQISLMYLLMTHYGVHRALDGEAINRDFVSTNFGERHNPFFKCEPDNLDISIGGENSNLSDSRR